MKKKLSTLSTFAKTRYVKARAFLASPESERGEETVSMAAITGLVLVIILAVMGIFGDALNGLFGRISGMLAGIGN